jgi:hypothetical protein
MQGTAFILIRSVVPNPDDRKAFDHWYETDHFPLVLSKINITQGWRFWSYSDPAVHYAFVEFSDMDELRRRFGRALEASFKVINGAFHHATA